MINLEILNSYPFQFSLDYVLKELPSKWQPGDEIRYNTFMQALNSCDRDIMDPILFKSFTPRTCKRKPSYGPKNFEVLEELRVIKYFKDTDTVKIRTRQSARMIINDYIRWAYTKDGQPNPNRVIDKEEK